MMVRVKTSSNNCREKNRSYNIITYIGDRKRGAEQNKKLTLPPEARLQAQ
jgi:hypothetical protein